MSHKLTDLAMERPATRRQALVVLGRLGALAGIVGGIGFLAARNANGANCALKNPCAACPKFSGCDLEKAQTARAGEAR